MSTQLVTMAADTLTTIGVVASVVAAVAAIAALWGVFVRFRPKFTARVDGNRQAVRFDVKNRGRLAGRVNSVALVNPDLVELPCKFSGLQEGKFQPAEISGQASRYLILAADRKDGPLPADAHVHVKWGRGRSRTVKPDHVEDASYYGMASDWI